MEKTIIAEGKTTNEAIENGLKQLKVSKDKVEVKVLENEDKRSFFSILTPRVVKVELTLKETESPKNKEKVIIKLSEKEQEMAEENIKKFMEDFIKNLPGETKYEIIKDKEYIKLSVNNEKLGFLIGYRGETLYALQNIISVIAGKGIENKVRVLLDIDNYKEKREKTLEELAQKVAKTVMRTKKPIKLEPMQPYERKIIHSKLQKNERIDTTSVGEEPYRRIVISLKK